MSSIANLLTLSQLKESNLPRAFRAAQLASALFFLHSLPAQAGSATTQFQVSARVVKSCRVSSDTFMQSQGHNGTTPVQLNCINGSAANAPAPMPVSATVTHTWVAGTEGSESTKIVTVNF